VSVSTAGATALTLDTSDLDVAAVEVFSHGGVRRWKKLRILILGFGTARQKMVLE
jgi:hypothetical protein